MEFERIITWLDWVTIIFSTITMVIVIWNLFQSRKQKEKVKIFFDVEGVDYLLNLDVTRRQISRSEIQGILSAFQKDIKSRYSIDYLSDISFLDDIFLIQQNKLDSLVIKLNNKEFEQFNQNKMIKQ